DALHVGEPQVRIGGVVVERDVVEVGGDGRAGPAGVGGVREAAQQELVAPGSQVGGQHVQLGGGLGSVAAAGPLEVVPADRGDRDGQLARVAHPLGGGDQELGDDGGGRGVADGGGTGARADRHGAGGDQLPA